MNKMIAIKNDLTSTLSTNMDLRHSVKDSPRNTNPVMHSTTQPATSGARPVKRVNSTNHVIVTTPRSRTQTPGRTPKSSSRVLSGEQGVKVTRTSMSTPQTGAPTPPPQPSQAFSNIVSLISEAGDDVARDNLSNDDDLEQPANCSQNEPSQEKSELDIIAEMLKNSDFFQKAGEYVQLVTVYFLSH